MNVKALTTLEYIKITGMLAARAVSVPGKERAEALRPYTEIGDIERAQAETADAASVILRKGSIPLGGIRDIRASVRRSLVGGMLTIEELLHVGDFLYVCRKITV